MHGIPLPVRGLRDAGLATGARSAAAGLARFEASDGTQWVKNPATGNDLQLIYTVKPGDFLSKIAGVFYFNVNEWPQIRRVPQNRALQGPSADKGLNPGDEILLPNLPFPGDAPANGNGTVVTLPGITIFGGGGNGGTGGATVPAVFTPQGGPPPVNGGTPSAAPPLAPTNGAAIEKKQDEGMHPGLIAAIAVAGVAAVGLIAYFATAPKSSRRRRNPRRRRGGRRRRR